MSKKNESLGKTVGVVLALCWFVLSLYQVRRLVLNQCKSATLR